MATWQLGCAYDFNELHLTAKHTCILLGKLILVQKHSIPTVDITAFENAWSLLKKFGTPRLLWIIEPGFWQDIVLVEDPCRTRHTILCAEIFDRSCAEGCPPIIKLNLRKPLPFRHGEEAGPPIAGDWDGVD
jgi:hypothetical protein